MKPFKLTEVQEKHYESIKWLVADGPRAIGRTTLLAMAFIEKAGTDLGNPVYVFDNNSYGDRRHILDVIVELALEDSTICDPDKFILIVNYSDYSFRIDRI